MDALVENLISDLWALSRQLGEGGGFVSPSVYDTAQCARFYPASDGGKAAIEWLLKQQQADGGFGDPAIPMARDVPTLAAALALNKYGHTDKAKAALSYLKDHVDHWKPPLPDDIPIGVELVLPRLINDANIEKPLVDPEPYQELFKLQLKRRTVIEKFKSTLEPTQRANALQTALHSWEAWGAAPDPEPNLFDGAGSMGHSPAATAAWLYYDGSRRKECLHQRLKAVSYLKGASAATGLTIPGVFPTSWPIDMFEILFAPYALLLGGLLKEQPFKDMMDPIVKGIEGRLKDGGLGFSSYFNPDGDDTAAGLAVIHAAGRKADLTRLKPFEAGTHFYTWRGELQPSLSATARAVHAFALMGENVTSYLDALIKHQRPDGRWVSDKWNASWLYTTCHVLAALAAAGCKDPVDKGVKGIVATQRPDGGWGVMAASTATETAYAVLGLLSAAGPQARGELAGPLRKAESFLEKAYRPDRPHDGASCWIAKEIYRPLRVDRAFELIALLGLKRHRQDAPFCE
jgi:hypothetical protein